MSFIPNTRPLCLFFQELRRKRNKSGLSASDRRMLNGEPPLNGLQYPMARYHFTQAFRYLSKKCQWKKCCSNIMKFQLFSPQKEDVRALRRGERRASRGVLAGLRNDPTVQGGSCRLKFRFFYLKLISFAKIHNTKNPKNRWRLNSTRREYEKVFYDGKTFEEIVAEERKKVDDALKYKIER